ncbi:MAG: hypothetical protein HYS27_05850 [Deltaproteobacteria bacterium]|nr:hypothetical protein [Deltaproteobacteria bacterium]
MPDNDDLTGKLGATLGTKLGGDAALAAGKAMAKRALDDLTLSPEEKQQREQQDQAKSRSRKIKLILGGVIAVVAVLSLMSVLAALWKYAIGLLLVLGVGGAGWLFAKPKLKALKARATARLEARKIEERAAAELEAKAAAEKAAADAVKAKQQKLEDELQALKQKAQ